MHKPGRPVPVQMWQGLAQSRRRCGSGEPSPGADVAAASPVLAQMWQRRAQSPCRCGRGEPSPQCHRREPSPGADVGWSRRRCGRWAGGGGVRLVLLLRVLVWVNWHVRAQPDRTAVHWWHCTVQSKRNANANVTVIGSIGRAHCTARGLLRGVSAHCGMTAIARHERRAK